MNPFHKISKVWKLQLFCLCGMLCIDGLLHAQVSDSLDLPDLGDDSISISLETVSQDSLVLDSLSVSQDSLGQPVSKGPNIPDGVAISDDAIPAEIQYDARDSIIYDILDKKIYLYGQASVVYDDLDLKAGFIIVDWEKNEVFAEHTLDSLQKPNEIPAFKNADQNFDAMSMRYNFKSQKGIIYDAKSQYNDLYILGSRAKFVAADQDSTIAEDHIYSSNALFTTCDHPHPHYGIRSKKQKVVPDKVVVVGPSNLELMGIPTPLVLPFGFFPISDTRTAGLIFPQDYTFSPVWGFGLENIGYYTPINDNLDASLTGDIYFNGTYGLHLTTNYKKIYKYTGALNLNWSERKSETRGVPQVEKSFSIRWNHSQDSRAHPTRRLSGSVNIQTNDYQSLNQNDATSVLQNSLSSNINFSKSFSGKPYSFTASAGHSQNTRTNQVTLNFPTAEFKTQTLFPFKRKQRKGKEKWYEQISATYSARFRSQVTATDTTLFMKETLEEIDFGMEQNVSSSTSFKLLKWLSVSPNIRYQEVWQPKSTELFYNVEQEINIDTSYNIDSTDFMITRDTIRSGGFEEIDDFGFNRWNQYSGGVSVNTQIFGIWTSEKGFLRGIRHLIKPTVSFNFSPDNLNEERGYFETLEYIDEFGEQQEETYGVYEGGIFGSPRSTGTQANISYGLNNIFEAKVFSKKDSTEQKIKLFDNLRFGGSYNVAADSLNWSPVTMSGTTRLLKGLTTIAIGGSWDPYVLDEETGRRTDRFQFRETGKILRFVGARAGVSTTFTIKKIVDLIKGEGSTDQRREERSSGFGSFDELFDGFNFRHQLNLNLNVVDGRDTLIVGTHTLSTSGNIQLTDQWNMRVGSVGYDFTQKRLTYPDLSFSRNLHCWETGLSWQPFRGTFSFYLRVTPSSTLNFLKIPFDKRNVDGFRSL